MNRPKGIPEGKIREVLEVRGLVNLSVKSQVLAIGVVEDGGHLEDTVKRGVKNGLLFFGSALKLDQGKPVLPGLLRPGQNIIEILRPGFRLEIGSRVFDADVGNRQFESDNPRLVPGPKTQINADSITLHRRLVGGKLIALPGGESCERLVEAGDTVH